MRSIEKGIFVLDRYTHTYICFVLKSPGKTLKNTKWSGLNPNITWFFLYKMSTFWLIWCLLKRPFKHYPHEPIFPRQIHPCHIFVKSKLCQFGGKFSRGFFSKWKKTEVSAYFGFNLLLISIFNAVLKENSN